MALRDFFSSLLGGDDKEEEEQQPDEQGLTFVQHGLPADILVADPEPVTWADGEELRGKAYYEGGLVGDDGTPLHNERSLAEVHQAAYEYGIFQVRTASPPEAPAPWQERFVSRDDGGLTDTTTGEITYPVEPVWESLVEPELPAPEPVEPVPAVQYGEINLDEMPSGEVTFAPEAPVGGGWNILGTFGPEPATETTTEETAEDEDDKETGGDGLVWH